MSMGETTVVSDWGSEVIVLKMKGREKVSWDKFADIYGRVFSHSEDAKYFYSLPIALSHYVGPVQCPGTSAVPRYLLVNT